jgi:hypothetical protein
MYLALTLTIIAPAFILIDYSFSPAVYTVELNELIYYAISGCLTWFFHGLMGKLISCPDKTQE